MTLLERGPLLAQLRDLLADSGRGRGRLVLVSGEAGIGKTALVEAFCGDASRDLDVLWGSCDAVVPARPFAPLADIADKVEGPLRAALDAVDRNRVFEIFLALLRQPLRAPWVVVFEDLHWADEATLDVFRVVGRRMRDLPVLFIGTYRNEDVGNEHPLRLALGDIPSGALVEIKVRPLSVEAVEVLIEGKDMDAVTLHGATGGNAFFVTEVVAAGEGELPSTVRDAVFARLRRLSVGGQQVLRTASVLGQGCDAALLRRVADCDHAAVAECLDIGMLQLNAGAIRFRHDLAQRAVAEGLDQSERMALHGRALAGLREARSVDPGRLAHHAVEAGDAEAVLELAPGAASRAAVLGAHREAAAHYAAALRFAGELDDRPRAQLLECHARESLLIDDVEGALASQQEALECWERLGDVRAEGNCLCALSHMKWFSGEGDRAVEVAERAVELLESASARGPELARAYATVAQRYMVNLRDESDVVSWSERAIELAERLGDEPVAIHALATLGIAEIYLGKEEGWTKLEQSWRRAEAAGLEEDVARAVINLVEAARDTRRYALVDRYRDEAIEYLSDHDVDLDLYRRRLDSDLAEVALERGRWDEATALANALLSERRTANVIRLKALSVLGRLRARRGDPDPWSLLDEALELADPQADGEHLCPLYAGRVETAWLEGNAARARAEAESVVALGLERVTDPWWRGELGFWAWRGGALDQLPERSAEPFVLHAAGRYRAAASAWKAIGCPYQRALALADSDDEKDLRGALEIFQSLGARPAAGLVVGRLRALGVRAIPRGPRPRTQLNPAGLTSRELEVLALLGHGLRNVDIAERLVVSAKTVDHHVSAILRKLGVPNRAAAANEAVRLGLEDGEIASPK